MVKFEVHGLRGWDRFNSAAELWAERQTRLDKSRSSRRRNLISRRCIAATPEPSGSSGGTEQRERQSVNKDAADTERRTNHGGLQQFTVQQTPGARTTTVFLMIVQANVVTYWTFFYSTGQTRFIQVSNVIITERTRTLALPVVCYFLSFINKIFDFSLACQQQNYIL